MVEKSVDFVVRICGSAGDGSIVSGQILNRALASLGFHIMNYDSYPAEIRGFGKSCAHTRFALHPVHTPGSKVNCLIALNEEHSISEMGMLAQDAIVIYDSNPPDYLEEDRSVAGMIEPYQTGYGIPLRDLSVTAVKNAKSRNMVGLGAFTGILNLNPQVFREAIRARFSSKPSVIIEGNLLAFELGYKWAKEDIKKRDTYDFGGFLTSISPDVKILSGSEAIAQACIDSGVRLYAGYPITPATKIMEILAKSLPKHGGVVIQTEDEISAIGHCIGGGFAGKRCVTATSGPGLCLMTEFINLAVMAEIPVVIIDAQRGGPSTGLPTKTEQSDFNISVFGGAGDSPRPVLAPTNVAECYSIIRSAFEVAEAYQTPVICLVDFFLSNRLEDIGKEELADFMRFQRSIAQITDSPYQRYAITETGISPMSFPSMEGLFYTATGLEHNPFGQPDYSPEWHMKMTEKRHKKIWGIAKQWHSPEIVGQDGDFDVGVISWGSTCGVVKEAITSLQKKGVRCGGFFPRLLFPPQTEWIEYFANRCKRIVVVEMNYGGQYANVVERIIHQPIHRISEVNVNPFDPDEIVSRIEGLL